MQYADLEYCVLILNRFTCKLCPLMKVQVVPYKNTTLTVTIYASLEMMPVLLFHSILLCQGTQTVAGDSDVK
jgi:hypothetical protein